MSEPLIYVDRSDGTRMTVIHVHPDADSLALHMEGTGTVRVHDLRAGFARLPRGVA